MLENPEMKFATGLLVSITNYDIDKLVAKKLGRVNIKLWEEKYMNLFSTDLLEGRGAAE